jgi:hypothetical protein
VNVCLKNKQNALKLFIEANVFRPKDYTKDHWESMKHLIASDTKQEVVRNRATRALVHTPNHSSCDGEVGIVGILVKVLAFQDVGS